MDLLQKNAWTFASQKFYLLGVPTTLSVTKEVTMPTAKKKAPVKKKTVAKAKKKAPAKKKTTAKKK